MYKAITKLFFTVLAVLLTVEVAMAQVPQGFNFQAVARDSDGELIANTELGVQVTILQGSEEGSAVYTETQSPETNSTGLFSLVIGEGSTEDDFSAIDWSSDNYYVKLEIDPAGGDEYEELGTTRLLSVPYALLAQDVVNGGSDGGAELNLPLDLRGPNNNMSVTLGTDEGDNNYGFLGLGNADGDTLARMHVVNFGDTVSQARMNLRDSFGRFSYMTPFEVSVGNTEDGSGYRSRLLPRNLYFINPNIDVPAPPAWFGTYQGDGFIQLLDYTETGAYEGGILSGFWPGFPTLVLEDGNETPLILLEGQKHGDRNVGVITLRGTDGSEFSISSDGFEGGGSGSAQTQYDLNTSEGDTSFAINAEGNTSILGAMQVRSQTDGSNRGVDSRVFSSAGNEASQLGLYGRSEGSGTGNHFGVYGMARGDQGVTGSRYGLLGWAESSGYYNYGIQAIARGPGDGTVITDFDAEENGSFNIGGGFYPSGNINGNTGIDIGVTGEDGERINIGGEFRVFTTAPGGNTGVNVLVNGSQKENFGFWGLINGDTINKGIILNVHGGQTNTGIEVYAENKGIHVDSDTAAVLNGYTEVNGPFHVNGDITASGSISETSDRNLKENIQPLQNGLGTIMKLNPTTYNFRGNGEYNGLKLSTGLHYGLIAQEVEEVLPSLVKDNVHTYSEISSTGSGPNTVSETEITKTMEYKTLNYTELIPVLVKAVQEQQQEIDELREEVEKLKKERKAIEQLRKDVEELKKKQ